MLAAVAVAVVEHLVALVALAVEVVVLIRAVIAQREQLTQVVVAVVVVIQAEFLTGVVRLAALVSLSSATQILLMMRHPQQAHLHSPTLVDIKSTSGQVLVQLHSEVTHGTLCTT
jgi:hypothetical protein